MAVGNEAPGYVQALPCGQAGGASSNLNLDAVGQIRSVLAVVAFDGGGAACLFNQMRTHLVADLQGWFAPARSTMSPTSGCSTPAPARAQRPASRR